MNTLLTNILDGLPNPVRILEQGEAGVPVYVSFNQAARLKTGKDDAETLGRSAEEVFPGYFGQIATAQHLQAWHCQQRITYDHEMPLAAGLRSLRTTLDPQLDQKGEVIRLVASTQDLTTEKANRLQATRAELLNSELEYLVSLAAHDLRTPMLHVKSIGEMLSIDFQDLGDGKKELIEKLGQLADGSMAMLTEMLKISSRVSLGHEHTRFDVAVVCKDILILLDPLRRHSLVCDSQIVTTDKTAVQIVLRNLIDNSLKHGGCTSLCITVSVVSEADNKLSFCVRDTGRGFNRSLESLFIEKTDRHISGFGLPSVRRLLMQRGGSITCSNVVSEKGGAAIKFTLPGVIENDDGKDEASRNVA